MLKRIKLLIKLKIVKIRMDICRKRWVSLRVKEALAEEKYKKVSSDYMYANEKLHPENAWEMRAEREFKDA